MNVFIEPLNIKIKDHINKFQEMISLGPKKEPQIAPVFEIEKTNEIFEEEEERFKLYKLKKG